MTKTNETKHLVVGYLFLALVFMGAIGSVYYWENKTKYNVIPDINRHVESGEQTPKVNGTACDLKVTQAKHKTTGEVREFPSPCHVNEYWEIVIHN